LRSRAKHIAVWFSMLVLAAGRQRFDPDSSSAKFTSKSPCMGTPLSPVEQKISQDIAAPGIPSRRDASVMRSSRPGSSRSAWRI